MKRIPTIFLACVMGVLFVATSVLAQEALQTQPSTDGDIEASLFEVKVRKGVLTLKTKLKNTSSNRVSVRIDFRDVYYADIEDKKKYFALKDAGGQFIAGPKYDDGDGGRFWYKIPAGKMKILWVKFPAPPDKTAAIDFFLPTILPFEEVLFDFDKWDVKKEAEPDLLKLARGIEKLDKKRVIIEGHTDSKGSEDYNMKLSQRRADAIKAWFISTGGLENMDFETKGFGEAKPIDPNTRADGSDNPEGRAKNRRVEIRIP